MTATVVEPGENITNIAPKRIPTENTFLIDNEFGLSVTNINGYICAPFIAKSSIDWLQKNFQIISSQDIFVVSYPKCGTMWLLNILVQIAKQKYGNCAQQHFQTIADAKWAETLVSGKGPKIFKEFLIKTQSSKKRIWQSHAVPRLFPASFAHGNKVKVVYICRNPKDCCVSHFNFFSKEPNTHFTGDFNVYFDMFCDGIVMFGNYFEHVLEWHREYQMQSSKYDILWVYFEDLKQNLEREIARIERFFMADDGSDDGKYPMLNAEQISLICQAVSFKQMKSDAKSKKIHLGESFFRKGKVGGWKAFMSDDQKKKLNRLIRAKFYGTGIRKYDDHQYQSRL